jgi:hypothetical protein
VIAGCIVTDPVQPAGIIVDILAALVPGIDLFDQIARAVIGVAGLLAHGPGLADQAVVAVVGKLGSLVLGVGKGDQVVAVKERRTKRVV